MSSYYKNIFEHFNKSRKQSKSDTQIVQRNSGANISVQNNSEQLTRRLEKDNVKGQHKRDVKFQRKTNLDLINNFFQINSCIKPTTLKRYLPILKDFQNMYPSLYPSNVFDYLKIKFELNGKDDCSVNFKRSTYFKYKYLLKNFMNMSYWLPESYFNSLDKPIPFINNNKDEVKISSKDVVSAYTQLIKLKMFDDALLIQLLFSLSLDAENLSMITHVNVDINGFINYKDYKNSEWSKILLDDHLICFMLDFCDIKGEKSPYFKISQRKSRNGEVESGIFLSPFTLKAIYSRFKGRFDGKLPWFCCTPNDIVRLNVKRVHEDRKNKQSIPILRKIKYS